MSFEAPLISILGRTRYDLPACSVNGRIVSNWNKVKNKLNLTDNEQTLMFKIFKSKYQLALKEKINTSSTCLEANKALNSIIFNNFMREFIDNYKICKQCSNPELCNYVCKACGFCVNKEIEVTLGEIPKKEKISKQEKRTNKINTQIEKEKNKETLESELDNEQMIQINSEIKNITIDPNLEDDK